LTIGLNDKLWLLFVDDGSIGSG